MNYTREEFLETLLGAYRSNYDLESNAHDDAVPLEATAHMHVSESKYALVKKAEMWAVDTDEFVYFFSVSKLTDELCKQCIDYAYEKGMAEIHLDENPKHMCTRLVALFIYDEIEPEAETRIKKCKIYKSFQHSLRGWMEFHTVGADLGKGSAISNRYGEETAKFLKSVFNPPSARKTGKGNRTLSGLIQKFIH